MSNPSFKQAVLQAASEHVFKPGDLVVVKGKRRLYGTCLYLGPVAKFPRLHWVKTWPDDRYSTDERFEAHELEPAPREVFA